MNKSEFQKGFTLIELLVVIAIIGILAAVILASLNNARSKGMDAAIKSDFSSLRSQIELYYHNQNPNSYGTASSTCSSFIWASSPINSIIAHLNLQSASVSCKSSADKWAASAQLKSDTSITWCIDSTGQTTMGTISVATGLCINGSSVYDGGSNAYQSGGVTWDGNETTSTMDQPSAVAYCTSLGGGWRLPSIGELMALYAVHSATPDYFQGASYWSSTPSGGPFYNYMTMISGTSNINFPSTLFRVHCVK